MLTPLVQLDVIETYADASLFPDDPDQCMYDFCFERSYAFNYRLPDGQLSASSHSFDPLEALTECLEDALALAKSSEAGEQFA
ncbi:MAG: hypothetical protein Tsb0013_14100 [Phycisphaerales bacterium]